MSDTAETVAEQIRKEVGRKYPIGPSDGGSIRMWERKIAAALRSRDEQIAALLKERDEVANEIEVCHKHLDTILGIPDDGTTSADPLDTRLSQIADEKQRRVYYQNIVYSVCNSLDRINRAGGILGLVRETGTSHIVCGTVDTPTTEVQDLMREVEKRIDTLYAENKRLRQQVHIAAGMLSTKAAWSDKHPEEALRFIQDATPPAKEAKP
jgi:hypothetical protein